MTVRISEVFLNFRSSFLIAFLVLLGGTSQAVNEPKVIIYILSVLVIFWVIHKVTLKKIYSTYPFVLSLFSLYIVYALIQIIPLPSQIWSAFPNRQFITKGFELLGGEMPYLPIAINPSAVLPSLLAVLPALAVFLLVACIASDAERRLAFWSVPVLGVLSLVLGFGQVILDVDYLQFYKISSPESEIGIFSNINHQATLTAISLCFVFVYLGLSYSAQRSSRDSLLFRNYILIAFTFIFTGGLLIYGSGAGYLFIPMVAVGTVCIFMASYRYKLKVVLGILLLIILFSVLGFWGLGGTKENIFESSLIPSTSRSVMFSTGWDIITHSWPVGTGLGTHPSIYPSYEKIKEVTHIYVPHLHNDYLELVLEMGIIGLIIIIVALGSVLHRAKSLFQFKPQGFEYSASALLGLLVILAHSAVDYPLRTISITAISALCVALLEVTYKRRQQDDLAVTD